MEAKSSTPKQIAPLASGLLKSGAPRAVADLVAELNNSALDLRRRQQAARALGRLGTAEAHAALKAALADAPPPLKAAIAEAIGSLPGSIAREELLNLLAERDETVVRGAIRGLATRNDADATEMLGAILGDAQRSPGVRTEAALALGDVPHPAAYAALTRAAMESGDETIREHALQGLARRPFVETEGFFRSYLESPAVDAEARVAALEAIGNAEGNVVPLLLQYATAADPEVRAAAAWALATADRAEGAGPALAALLGRETDPAVRRNLYQALITQGNYDPAAILSAVSRETDPAARRAGLNLLGAAAHSGAAPGLRAYFDQTAVPELRALALTSSDPVARLDAVIALRRANTPAALTAMAELAASARDPKVAEAARAGAKTAANR